MKNNEKKLLLRCEKLLKRFGETVAVNGATITLEEGELLAILGPSGCGKSTLLRMIAGLVQPDEGVLCYNDTVWSDQSSFIPAEERDCGMVFQDMALFPHLSIGDNIGFALKWRKKRCVVEKMLKLVGMEGMARRMTYQLSGGQQQRVALARSLAPEPGLLLLDEPFSSLDLKLRQTMRREVRKILKEQGVTAILVTHDQNEAFAFADTVAVISHGSIEQLGSPQTIYQSPATKTTASFVGDANFIELDKAQLLFPELKGLSPKLSAKSLSLMCRPENILLRTDGEGAVVREVEFQGAWQELLLEFSDTTQLKAHTDTTKIWCRGERLGAAPASGCLYCAKGLLQGTFYSDKGRIICSEV